MRKLIIAEFISLDGVIQAPGGPDEDPSGEFRFGGWQVPYNDEAIGRAVLDLFSQPFELLLGVVPTTYGRRIGRALGPIHPATRSLARSTACASTWPRIDRIRWTGRTATRSRAILPMQCARSNARTAATY